MILCVVVFFFEIDLQMKGRRAVDFRQMRPERPRRGRGSERDTSSNDEDAPPRTLRRLEDSKATREGTVPRAAASTSGSLDSKTCDFDDRGLEVFLREFLKAVRVSDEDVQRRSAIITDVQDAVGKRGLYSEVYGSARTGVLLPSSDLDFYVADEPIPTAEALKHSSVIFGSRAERHAAASSRMRHVVNALRADRRFTQIIRIAHANVPIVKAVHRASNTQLDFSFTHDGILTSELLNRHMALEHCRLARGLVIVIKALLAQWNVNDPSTGGLGSFPVSLMVLWFLESEGVHYGPGLRNSFSVNLIGFLKYFGEDFDFKNFAIDFGRRQTIKKPLSVELTILNPLEPSRNAAKACTKYGSEIRKMFKDTRDALMRIAMEPANSMKISSLHLIMRLFESTLQTQADSSSVGGYFWTRLTQFCRSGDNHVSIATISKKVSLLPQGMWNELQVYTGGNVA